MRCLPRTEPNTLNKTARALKRKFSNSGSHLRCPCLFGWLVGFLTSSSITRLYRGRAPRQSVWQFYVLPHMRQSGDHDFYLNRSHYTDTDPISRERATTAGIELPTSSTGVARSTDWATAPPVPMSFVRKYRLILFVLTTVCADMCSDSFSFDHSKSTMKTWTALSKLTDRNGGMIGRILHISSRLPHSDLRVHGRSVWPHNESFKFPFLHSIIIT